MDRVRKQIGCEEVPYSRKSRVPVTVAVLDTGIAMHPDLQGRITAFRDFVSGRQVPYDDNSHGTHVCGIIGGNGSLSQGKYRGICPECRFVVGKVLDVNGDGSAGAMIQGISWIIQNSKTYNIRILNISIGIGRLDDEEKMQQLTAKIEEAWNAGLTVVCAAGNLGPEAGSISPLGSSSKVITVGCHDGSYFKDKTNRCETYSGRGPTESAIKKPDIVAPGTEIVSCNAKIKKVRTGYSNAYTAKSGTSMATPIVSGSIALLLEKEPGRSNEAVKKKLVFTATDLKEPWTKQGWGMINVKRLLE